MSTHLERELSDVMIQVRAIERAQPAQAQELERREQCVQAATAARDAYLSSLPAASSGSVSLAGGVSVAGFISSPMRVIAVPENDRTMERLTRALDDAVSDAAVQGEHIRRSRTVLSGLQARASDLRHELASESGS